MFCPLTGKPCSNPRTVEFHEYIQGQLSIINLCDTCACHTNQVNGKIINQMPSNEPKKEQPNLPPPFVKNITLPGGMPVTLFGMPISNSQNPLEYFANLIDKIENHQPKEPHLASCPQCGYTLADIQKSGRLGCNHCYIFFKQQIMPLIQNLHENNSQHTGKVPLQHTENEIKEKEKIMIENSLASLEKQLQLAVKEEKYENAGKIRDQIKYLKSKLNN